MKQFFITSSGTDIGKTYLTTLLCKSLIDSGKTVTALKPIISGWDVADKQMDILQIIDSLGLQADKKTIDNISLFRFKEALSPDMAARKEGKEIDFAKLINFCKQNQNVDYQLIEGVGGVMVPLTDKHTVIDWIKELNIATIMVVGSYLGSISYTLTALECLKSRNIKTASLVISESENSVDLEELSITLRNFTDLPIITLSRGKNIILNNSVISQIFGE